MTIFDASLPVCVRLHLVLSVCSSLFCLGSQWLTFLIVTRESEILTIKLGIITKVISQRSELLQRFEPRLKTDTTYEHYHQVNELALHNRIAEDFLHAAKHSTKDKEWFHDDNFPTRRLWVKGSQAVIKTNQRQPKPVSRLRVNPEIRNIKSDEESNAINKHLRVRAHQYMKLHSGLNQENNTFGILGSKIHTARVERSALVGHGAPGSQGHPGTPGQTGAPGTPDLQAPAATMGHSGAPARDGTAGGQSALGAQAQPGTPGQTGTPWTPASQDPAGAISDNAAPATPGIDGEPGQGGPQGAPGSQGPAGAPGIPFSLDPAGARGDNTAPGTPSRDGAPGTPGAQGQPGTPGQSGAPGQAGARGDNGAPGTPGRDGAPGIPGPRAYTGSVGSAYIRWGRTTCHGDGEFVYPGFITGSQSVHGLTGSSVMQCLPLTPETSTNTAQILNVGNTIVVAAQFDLDNEPRIPACALCYVTRSAMIMIPGRSTCPYNWSLEYKGYLMSAAEGSERSVSPVGQLCIDDEQESFPTTKHYRTIKMKAVTANYCSSSDRHCNRYFTQSRLSCVVCSR